MTHFGYIEGAFHRSPEISYIFANRFASPSETRSPTSTSRMHRIVVDFSDRDVIFDDAFNCDWDTFDVHVARFAKLGSVVLSFATTDDMSRFLQTVVQTRLTRLISKNKLVYAVRKDGKPGENWMYTSSTFDSMRGVSASRFIRDAID